MQRVGPASDKGAATHFCGRKIGIPAQIAQTIEQRAERHFHFLARQVLAKAGMSTGTKGEVAFDRTMDVERIGVVPLLAIVIGRTKAQHRDRTRLHRYTFKHGILFDIAQKRSVGRVPAGDLLNRLAHQAAILAQRCHLFGMVEQGHDGDAHLPP